MTLPISAVIPAYNRADLLPRAIASVRAQTCPPAEIIVVDDHSSDGTGAVASSLGARVIRHDRNQGEGAARNSGVAAATQAWVAFLDDDDEWTRRHLEHVFGLRNDHVLVASAVLRQGRRAGDEDRIYGVTGRNAVVLRSPAEVAYPVHLAPASAVMFLRQAVLDAGGFDPSLRLCTDFDMSLRMLEQGTGIASPAIGAIYHVHGGQVSRDQAQMHRAHYEILGRYQDHSWCSSSLLRRSDGVIAWDSFRRDTRERRPFAALSALVRIITHPDRLRGAARILLWRMRARRGGARAPTGELLPD